MQPSMVGFDDSRRFHCAAGNCSGVHFVKQCDSEMVAEILSCTRCGHLADDKQKQRMLAHDDEQSTRTISYIDHVIDQGLPIDVTDLVDEVVAPHPHHRIALPIFRAKSTSGPNRQHPCSCKSPEEADRM